jgi:hypothetical protein
MPINYEIGEISDDLEDFRITLRSIDMESVKERTLKRVAQEMSKMVRQAVFESSIKSPADKISPYEGGPGPPLATGDAWIVKKEGANYVVRPHPEVRQRAVVLNFGYPGEITPNNGEFLRFMVEGEPVFARSVSGPEATGYWQAAYQRMENSGKLEDIAGEELRREFEEST